MSLFSLSCHSTLSARQRDGAFHSTGEKDSEDERRSYQSPLNFFRDASEIERGRDQEAKSDVNHTHTRRSRMRKGEARKAEGRR